MPTTDLLNANFRFSESASAAEILGAGPKADEFSFLSFLATAQTFGIEFLPLVWDTGGGIIGNGGTSRIQQALLDINTSFAFKTYHKRGTTDEKVFQTLITEVTVLSQAFVREHPNISQLQGICWDISPDDDKPWPVLVFEKSHLGDLYHFARYGGKDMTLEQRLGLCLDIGRAIMDMHSNQIVHGDIKPDNVLIFRDESGRYSARVIDFGYSTRYVDDKQRLILPRSEPWNAPENNGRARTWTPLQAVKSDLFCLGMLYLWLLFEPHLQVIAPTYQSQKMEETLCRMKEELPAYAHKLLALDAFLPGSIKKVLGRLFESTLMQDPEKRDAGSVQEFLRHLDPHRTDGRKIGLANLEHGIESGHFEIKKSIQDLYCTDYRVRSYITQCLLDKSSQSEFTALQAALCYYIGFGVKRDEAKAKELLNQSKQTARVIKDMIADLHLEHIIFKASTRSHLHNIGISLWSNFSYIYLEQGIIDIAEAKLMQERTDLISTCGTDHILVELSDTALAEIYNLQSRWKEAEKLQMQVMEVRKIKLGADHPDTLTSMANLALTYRSQGRWEEAEKLHM